MEWNVEEKDEFTVVEFNLDWPMEPADLRNLSIPQVDPTRGVILSGRGPVWLYAYLVHHYHPVAWIATYDPRVGGAVVVQSHTKGVVEGEVVQV